MYNRQEGHPTPYTAGGTSNLRIQQEGPTHPGRARGTYQPGKSRREEGPYIPPGYLGIPHSGVYRLLPAPSRCTSQPAHVPDGMYSRTASPPDTVNDSFRGPPVGHSGPWAGPGRRRKEEGRGAKRRFKACFSGVFYKMW